MVQNRFSLADIRQLVGYIRFSQSRQQVSRDDDDTYTALTKFIGRQEIVPQVSSYKIEMGPSGTLASDWSYLSYCTKGANTSGNWTKLMNNDALVVNIGYNGTLDLTIILSSF